MTIFAVASFELNDYTIFEYFCEAFDSLGQYALCHVRLFEIVVAVINDDGDAFFQWASKILLQINIARFGYIGREFRKSQSVSVVIHVEMLRLQEFPFEILVLYLIFPKILGSKTRWYHKKQQQQQCCPGDILFDRLSRTHRLISIKYHTSFLSRRGRPHPKGYESHSAHFLILYNLIRTSI